MPLVVMAAGVLFNMGNAYLNGHYLFTLSAPYQGSWLLDPRFFCGVLLFFAGMAINIHSDEILLHLRRPGESGYKVPRGGLFRLVSCPNYLGEMVEWFGWALLTWSLPGLCFFLWTFANLVPRALSSHRFYRSRFPNYPPERRAVFPFLL